MLLFLENLSSIIKKERRTSYGKYKPKQKWSMTSKQVLQKRLEGILNPKEKDENIYEVTWKNKLHYNWWVNKD